ncbi:Uncharacterised protein [Mycobacteroides abscessus subsp. massiliense]|nr:Uncharacterised protein [Mycobacteroides abscessus subsp. massiliense]
MLSTMLAYLSTRAVLVRNNRSDTAAKGAGRLNSPIFGGTLASVGVSNRS